MTQLKKIFVMIAVGVLYVGGVYATEELMKNGDFSAGLADWKRQGAGLVDIRIDNKRLFFQKKDDVFSALYQDVDINDSGSYAIEVHADNRNMPGSTVVVIPYINGKFSKIPSYVRLSPVDGIQKVKSLINLGNGVTKVRVAIHCNKTGTFFSLISLKQAFARESQQVPELADAPVIDGDLKDTFWTKALKLDDFRILGMPLKQSEVATQVFIATNKDALYVAFNVEEPAIKDIKLVRKNTIKIYGGDDVELYISPDREQHYQFVANAEGFNAVAYNSRRKEQLRGVWYEEPGENDLFHGNWQVAAQKGSGEYTVEMAIQLNDLIIGKNADNQAVLYMNFCRHRTLGVPAEAYLNWVGLAGKSFKEFHNYPEFRLARKSTTDIAAKSVAATTKLAEITEPLSVPELLMVGKPIIMIIDDNKFELPKTLVFEDGAFPVDAGVKSLVSRGLTDMEKHESATIRIVNWDDSLLPTLTGEERKRMESSSEAFILKIIPRQIIISARTHAGALRALATVALLGSQSKSSTSNVLPCMVMADAPYFEIRGWDAGGIRDPENLKKLLDLYYLLRLNCMQFEVSTYGQHATFPFTSHPDIGSGKFSKKDFSDLADYARVRGISLIPLFYSWSRAGFIFNKPKYEALAASNRPGLADNPMGVHNRNANAFDPHTEEFIFALYDELIDTMKLTHLNPGLDEVHFSTVVDQDAPFSRGKTSLDWFKTVIGKTQAHLASKGVTMWMFADELNPYHNGPLNNINDADKDMSKLQMLPKDVIMMPWHYEVSSSGRYDSVAFFQQAGFPVVGCPAWYRINNVPTFIHDLYRLKAKGIMGTTWGNSLPHSKDTVTELLSAVSLLAYLSWSPDNCELADIKFIPSTLYQHIAFYYGNERAHAKKTRSLELSHDIASSSVSTLKKELGFPEYIDMEFLKKSFSTWRGVVVKPFMRNNETVAIAVHGSANESVTIPLSGMIDSITVLHTTNKIFGYERRDIRKFADVVPGYYDLTYTDGSKASLPLQLRVNINEWNDGLLGKKCEPGIFGSMAGKLHVNISIFTWDNPFPDKEVKSLIVRSGNRRGINLYLLGISFE